MSRASASVKVPGRAADAEALWYDHDRWPSWVDGFGHVVSLDSTWPQPGARLIWDSKPGGRGRVLERVTAYEQRTGQTVEVEDARLRGVQRVAFQPGDGEVTVSLTLDYELKARTPLTPIVDFLFVRRSLGDSLRRTLQRFGIERRGDLGL